MGKLIGRENATLSSVSQLASLVPGVLGSYLRRNLYSLVLNKGSRRCSIVFGTIFSHSDTDIHDGVYIGAFCNIGKCSIGKNTLLGSSVHILSGNKQHNFEDVFTPIQEQGGSFEKVQIGEDSWIGNGAIIMANIGKKCIVASGSVVTKDLPDFSIAAGNPARILRSRLEEKHK